LRKHSEPGENSYNEVPSAWVPIFLEGVKQSINTKKGKYNRQGSFFMSQCFDSKRVNAREAVLNRNSLTDLSRERIGRAIQIS
jgi:hypothetical protein